MLSIFSGCLKQEKSRLKGDYIGQEPPGSAAQLFAPDIISTGMYTRDIAMTPDLKEVYFSVSLGNFEYSTIVFVKETGGKWSKPQVAGFANNLNYKFLEPAISPDGKKFYFVSNMPAGGDTINDMDIWVMNREGDGWSRPVNLGSPVNSDEPEFFPSVTNDGTLYFTRDNPDGTSYIHRSKFINGEYSEVELLDKTINAGRSRFNAFIAPDESYIIVPTYGMPDSYGATDYYISFRMKDDTWKGPFNMGEKVNSSNGSEWSPYVSPDGKYFFFMSGRLVEREDSVLADVDYNKLREMYNQPGNGNPGIYWIDASIFDSLKAEYITE
jgi:Tol biopolymer transport system component